MITTIEPKINKKRKIKKPNHAYVVIFYEIKFQIFLYLKYI